LLLDRVLSTPSRTRTRAGGTTLRTKANIRPASVLAAILFAVTPGVDVVSLRKRAEAILLDVRCHDGKTGDTFANAPPPRPTVPAALTAAILAGSTLPTVHPNSRANCSGHTEVGVLPRLVHSRFRTSCGRGAGTRAGVRNRSTQCEVPWRCHCDSLPM
jgi:hypothetical protein